MGAFNDAVLTVHRRRVGEWRRHCDLSGPLKPGKELPGAPNQEADANGSIPQLGNFMARRRLDKLRDEWLG